MKKMLIFLLLLSVTAVFAQTVTVQVTTNPTSGKFSPKHALAVWITDSKGTFIKTLKIQANKQMKQLKQWINSSKKDKTDAVTGATLKKHITHNITWDCKDLKKKIVADGDYFINIEYSEINGEGPFIKIPFVKGKVNMSSTPKDTSAFSNMKVNYSIK